VTNPNTTESDKIQQLLGKDACTGAFILLAENYLQQEKYELSVDVCRRGLQLYPEQLDLIIILGQALVALNFWDEAEETLDPAVKEIRRLGVVFALVEKLYQRKRKFAEAQEAATIYQLLQGQQAPSIEDDFWDTDAPDDMTVKKVKVINTLIKWQQALQVKGKKVN
jgi:tetratricopeptide (TPR) repeat protein